MAGKTQRTPGFLDESDTRERRTLAMTLRTVAVADLSLAGGPPAFRTPLLTTTLLLLAALLVGADARALTNGVALTPPMGYNSWYGNTVNISDALVRSVADQMATNGMKDAGYQYVNLDDGWAGNRDSNGVMVPVPSKFPNGMKAVADYVHSRGLKFGLYTTGSTNTCGYYAGSIDHEIQDANTYAQWGVDFVKFEGCLIPWYELFPEAQVLSVRMQQALLHCGRPMVFSLSIGAFENWMPMYCNQPRGTGDYGSDWPTILYHIDYVASSPFVTGPGIWNDPDVVDVGPDFTTVQNTSIFSMWCELAAPLIVRSMDASYTNIQCNLEAIAVDQDAGGIQGRPVASNAEVQVWSKPLGGSNSTVLAVVLLNRGSNSAAITANWSDLGLPSGVATVRDLWAHDFAGYFTNSYSASLPPYGCLFLKIAAGARPPPPPPGTNYLSDLTYMADWSSPLRPIQLDKAASFGPITLRGAAYAKGLGVLGNTTVNYYLAGTASRFHSDIGIDDSAGSFGGSFIFEVYGDGEKLYDSGIVSTNSPVKTVDVDISGRNVLSLVTIVVGTQSGAYTDWAGARITVPVAPTGLAAAADGSRITLTWNPAAGATGYLIERSTTDGGPYSPVGSSTNTSYTDTNVASSEVYYYVVSAINANPGGQTTNTVQIVATLPAVWADAVTAMAQDWNTAVNWTNASSFPDQSDAGALVNGPNTSSQIINLNEPVSVGTLTIGAANGSAAYTIAASGGSLTFDNGTNQASLTQLGSSAGDTIAAPVILNSSLSVANNSSNVLTVSGGISGPGELTANGPGVLLLSGSNSFSTAVSIAGGTVRTGNAFALGVTNATATVASGATLDLGGFDLGADIITVAGAGVGGSGAIISTAVSSQTNALQFVTFSGNATIGGTGDWDIRGANAAVPSAVLSTAGEPWSLTKTGPDRISLAAVQVDPALGDMDIQRGVLSFEGVTTSMGAPANTLSVEAGATLAFSKTTNLWNKNFSLYGDGVTASISNVLGSNTLAGPIGLAGNCVLSVPGGALALVGPISGAGGLTKTLGGTLNLGGVNTYPGGTIVNSGRLVVTASGSIAGSTNLFVSGGATLDVSAMPGSGLTLAAGQTLGGAGTVNGNIIVGAGAVVAPADNFATLTCNNALTFSGGSVVIGLRHPPLANEQVRVLGPLTYGGTLVLTNLGTNALLAGDTFQPFSAGSYAGIFTNVVPQRPGSGLAWDTSGLAASGTVSVVVAGPAPRINRPVVQAGGLVMAGSGGTPNGAYHVLTSTNAALPLALWTRTATSAFDGSGSFRVTNNINPAVPRLFYAVQFVPQLRINALALAGNNLILSGLGGTVSGPYYVLAAPDPTMPLAQWTRVATNHFDAVGGFQFTNTVIPGVPAMFYHLQIP
jgi:alpha-galactosidase